MTRDEALQVIKEFQQQSQEERTVAKQTTQTGGILAKFAGKMKQAFNTHKSDETELSNFGELPPKIEAGIAQLVLCKFGVFESGDNKGQPYFMAQGIVLSPREAQTYDDEGKPMGKVVIEGLRTRIGPEPLCDTPDRQGEKARRTTEDHLAWTLNELRKLGLDTDNLDYSELESAVQMLEEAQPTFRFRTWRGKPTEAYPDPKVNHMWNGIVDFTPPSDSSSGDVVDTSGEEEVEEAKPSAKSKTGSKAAATSTTNGKTKAAAPVPVKTAAKASPGKAGTKPATKAKQPEPEPEEELVDDMVEFSNEDLVQIATDEGDENQAKAQNALEARAIAAGLTKEFVDGAKSWEEVVAAIEEGAEGDTAADEEGEEESSHGLSEGDVVKYRAIDPKTKKPGKPLEYTITKIDEGSQTVYLKSLDTKKALAGAVAIDKLIVD